MKILRRFIFWISDLKVAIILLLVIALLSAIGTVIPQGEAKSNYIKAFNENPWLGLLNGSLILTFQLDHVYTSSWFLFLLAWLGLALIICSWRRQLPALKAAAKWIDYKDPRQLSKLAVAKTISTHSKDLTLEKLATTLEKQGWQICKKQGRLAARKGLIGRIGPPLVHIGMVVLMIGAVWGGLSGQHLERFLAPGRSFDLLNQDGISQLTLSLKNFRIDRSPTGAPEQFKSILEIFESNQESGNIKEISVNHPLRYRGMTIYQADWALAAITLQLGESPLLQVPLTSYPELGSQTWGVVVPIKPDGTNPVLISLTSETGPAQIFDSNGTLLGKARPGGQAFDFNGTPIRVVEVIPSSGLLLKRDPGVPVVYTGFAITLIGGALSMIATKQLWAVSDPESSSLHIGGLCNRNLTGLANELPSLLEKVANL